MGKYMRKAKLSGEVVVMEVSQQASLGVRTRARALAALQKSTAPDASLAYLELRSRRLEKPLLPSSSNRLTKDASKSSPETGTKGSAGSLSLRQCPKSNESAAADTESSFVENVLKSETRERFITETSSCRPVRDSQTDSTTRPTKSALINRRIQNPLHLSSPTALEMEEFFSSAEQLQQRLFMEKYNFDLANGSASAGHCLFSWTREGRDAMTVLFYSQKLLL